MSRIDAPLMLVGSVPLSGTEEVLAACSDELGELVDALPDGETGYRTNWVNFQAYFVHHSHPDLDTLQRPDPSDGVLQWSPSGFADLWNFRVRDGVQRVEYGDLFYAEEAIRSYTAFRDLKDAGRIAARVRFQVSLPTPPGAIMAFFREEAGDYERVRAGYESAMAREIERIVDAIPADELAIQWDVCNEVMDIEHAYPWLPVDRDGWDRFLGTVHGIADLVPEPAALGYHLCYGDLGGHHIVEPTDLGVLTRMANAIVAESKRTVDWLHMPVPIARDDDDYFVPLADLRAAGAHLFLGLIHPRDGVEGAQRRLAAARRRYDGPLGVSTECGFGRRPSDTVRSLLELHRQVAEELFSVAHS